jgi:arylsulfatase
MALSTAGGIQRKSIAMKQNRLPVLAMVAMTVSTALLCASCAKAQPSGNAFGENKPAPTGDNSVRKPNVIFILADNVGYGDMGCYGGGELRGAPTPNIDRIASEGLRLTQYLVEPACTPSRCALMTGRYSIREGLSLIIVPGTPSTLSAKSVTMAQLFKSQGYATAIFGKWHLGSEPQSLPTAHGFDEFYGIPPDTSWDSCEYVSTIELTHSIPAPPNYLLEKGPQIYEGVAGGELKKVKPFTPEVRAEIDNELVAKSIDFMKRQTSAGKPFFLYLPFSMGHIPNLPSSQFKGKSRIGNYGDKMMEGDYHVGEILDQIKQLGIDENTLVVFASDNGPSGEGFRAFGNLGTADMGNSGPFRGELGEATEGSIRTCCVMRWPGHIKPGTTSYAMFSTMDFFPTFAHVIGAQVPTDKPIDGVDQTDVLLGKSETGHREAMLSFVGNQLLAARWKQWRLYFTDVHPTGIGPERLPGIFSASSPMAGYPKVYNIEIDPHEDHDCAGYFGWSAEAPLKEVEKYMMSTRKYPNPPAPNITDFKNPPGE